MLLGELLRRQPLSVKEGLESHCVIAALNADIESGMRRHGHVPLFRLIIRAGVGCALRDRIAPEKAIAEEEDGALLVHLETRSVIDSWKVSRRPGNGGSPKPISLPPFGQGLAAVNGIWREEH